jgi:hypothetical protein
VRVRLGRQRAQEALDLKAGTGGQPVAARQGLERKAKPRAAGRVGRMLPTRFP